MYMGIQNSTTCACGYTYGQYAPASNSSLCTKCTTSYNCGGPGLNSIYYLTFFQYSLICPYVVIPGQTFTCNIQVSFNLASGQSIVDPFGFRIYPTYENNTNSFIVIAPLPLLTSNSFAYNSSMLTTQFSFTYDNSSSSRVLYANPLAYTSATAQQTIYVASSI